MKEHSGRAHGLTLGLRCGIVMSVAVAMSGCAPPVEEAASATSALRVSCIDRGERAPPVAMINGVAVEAGVFMTSADAHGFSRCWVMKGATVFDLRGTVESVADGHVLTGMFINRQGLAWGVVAGDGAPSALRALAGSGAADDEEL